MYPFDSKRKWWLAGRPAHVVAGFEKEITTLRKATQKEGEKRVKSLKKAMKIQIGLFIFFYFSFVTTAFSWLAQVWGKLSALEPAMDAIAGYVSTLSAVILVCIFIVRRHISVLEADLLLLLSKLRKK